MKKIILSFIFSLMIGFSLSSCNTTETVTTDDIYVETVESPLDVVIPSDMDFNIVIRYGIPYYYNGKVLYYLYNHLYYYPFYYGDYWYVRVYRHPINHFRHRPVRPNRFDYKFRRKPHYDRVKPHHRPNQPRPNVNHRKPNMDRYDNRRPNVGVPRTPQPTNRNNRPNGNNSRMGGRR